MGLGDLRAKLLLFFATKLRDWANSINEKVQSSPLQPASVAVDRLGSEPVTEPGPDDDAPDSEPSHSFALRSGGPPQHWIDLVRERAPELLSLTPEYSPQEVALPEDHAHLRRSDMDDEVEISDQRPVNVPKGNEDVVRKLGPVPLLPPKVGNKRSSRKLTRVQSSLPRPKPLMLKPLNEPNPHLQPPRQARSQVPEPVKPVQLIEGSGSDKQTITSTDHFNRGARNKDQVATRESTQPPSQQVARSDRTAANYETTKRATPKVPAAIPAAQAPDELNVTSKPEVSRPAFNVVKKPQSAPRRYLQAIVGVTRKTHRRTASGEAQSARAITVVNLLNPPSQRSSSMPDAVRVVEAPKTVTNESEVKAKPLTVVSAGPTNLERRRSKPEPRTVVSARPTNLERRHSKAEPLPSPLTGSHSKVPIDNVKTTSRPPSIVESLRPARRVANASNTHIQDAFRNMPALMDEEKMNRASSMHLANLRPGKNDWPDLPPANAMEVADELAAYERDIERMRRLKQEQRGTPWNE